MREVAGWDYRKAREVARWPIREMLMAYLERLRERALEGYRWESLQYSVIAPYAKKESGHKPPRVPDILRKG